MHLSCAVPRSRSSLPSARGQRPTSLAAAMLTRHLPFLVLVVSPSARELCPTSVGAHAARAWATAVLSAAELAFGPVPRAILAPDLHGRRVAEGDRPRERRNRAGRAQHGLVRGVRVPLEALHERQQIL
eukprot:3047634-Rhodomonas_salina.2